MWPDQQDDFTDEEHALFGAYNTTAELAAQIRRLRDMDLSASKAALELVVNTLVTELWDQRFSQQEIREAFMAALEDMNRYAAGSERRE